MEYLLIIPLYFALGYLAMYILILLDRRIKSFENLFNDSLVEYLLDDEEISKDEALIIKSICWMVWPIFIIAVFIHNLL